MEFPALDRLNEEANMKMNSFKQFLEELKALTIEKKILGILNPLTPDHMYREECYYQTKMSLVSKIENPECDPAKPRFGE
jgi:subtilase family serine protease